MHFISIMSYRNSQQLPACFIVKIVLPTFFIHLISHLYFHHFSIFHFYNNVVQWNKILVQFIVSSILLYTRNEIRMGNSFSAPPSHFSLHWIQNNINANYELSRLTLFITLVSLCPFMMIILVFMYWPVLYCIPLLTLSIVVCIVC